MGKRSQGGLTNRYKDTLKAYFNDFNIQPEISKYIPQDRANIRKAADNYKARESVKLNESARSVKKDQRDHHQSGNFQI